MAQYGDGFGGAIKREQRLTEAIEDGWVGGIALRGQRVVGQSLGVLGFAVAQEAARQVRGGEIRVQLEGAIEFGASFARVARRESDAVFEAADVRRGDACGRRRAGRERRT